MGGFLVYFIDHSGFYGLILALVALYKIDLLDKRIKQLETHNKIQDEINRHLAKTK